VAEASPSINGSFFKERNVGLNTSFTDLWSYWHQSVVVQRADRDTGGRLGTFFIRAEDDWQRMHAMLSEDEGYQHVIISPLIDEAKYSPSMLGCVTGQGVLTTGLQLQLIDVPEALCRESATGVFLGHDWGCQPWSETTEVKAQRMVEAIGAYLERRGYKGIFEVDFVYDSRTDMLVPIECNPRFTGVLPVYSLMLAEAGIPTPEFFHILAHLGIDSRFNFTRVNKAWKQGWKKLSRTYAYISVTSKGITDMPLSLTPGIYAYDRHAKEFRFKRPGMFLWDFESDDEFMIIDSIPRCSARVDEGVPRLFKLVFPHRIAQSSREVEPEVGEIITNQWC